MFQRLFMVFIKASLFVDLFGLFQFLSKFLKMDLSLYSALIGYLWGVDFEWNWPLDSLEISFINSFVWFQNRV